MTNPKKKKKTEIIEVWKELKQRIISILKNPGTVQVYGKVKSPQEIMLPPGAINSLSLKTLKAENQQLHYLHSLETSLKDKAVNWRQETEQYEKRIRLTESKLNNSQKKLDKVKDLIANDQIIKLKQLLKEGKI